MAKARKIANSARPSRAATRSRDWKTPFLAALAKLGDVTRSARAAGVDRRTAQTHRKEDAAFAEGWDEALDVYADKLEAVADHRAVEGVAELVLHEGVPVFVLVDAQGQVQPPPTEGRPTPKGWRVVPLYRHKPSDALLQTRLRALRPDKYRDRMQVTHDGKLDGPRTPAERAGEAAALLAELREQLGPDAGPAPKG